MCAAVALLVALAVWSTTGSALVVTDADLWPPSEQIRAIDEALKAFQMREYKQEAQARCWLVVGTTMALLCPRL